MGENKKISELTEVTTLNGNDELVFVHYEGGNPGPEPTPTPTPTPTPSPSPTPTPVIPVPLTDTNFFTARDLWFSDEGSATTTYGHIKDWDVSAVTNMAETFKDKNSFNEDISGWDVSNVTTMIRMFQWANIFNQNIGNWNTTKVTDMYSMFLKADAFNQDINTKEVTVNGTTYVAWNTSSVTTMGYMFWKVAMFDQNIRGWNVGNVTDYDSFDTETKESWIDEEKPCWGYEECPTPTPTPVVAEITDNKGYCTSISGNGNIVAIGNPEQTVGEFTNVGCAKVYLRNGNDWNMMGSVINGINKDDFFGSSVDLSEDGQTLVVGGGGTTAFKYDGASWNKLGTIDSGNWGSDNWNSKASIDKRVAICDSGLNVATALSHSLGTIFIHRRESDTWVQKFAVSNPFDNVNNNANTNGSAEIAISGDGNTVALGLKNLDTHGGYNTGQVIVFKYELLTDSWASSGTLTHTQSANDYSTFGSSVSLNYDGTILAVGAEDWETTNSSYQGERGIVYVYNYITSWSEVTYFIGDSNKSMLGNAVDLSSDGKTLAMASWERNNNGLGHVDICKFTDSWSKVSRLSGESAGARFGQSISISKDGSILAVTSGNRDKVTIHEI